jgi:glycerate dehydrogenase
MRALFLDYATVSFADDLDPQPLLAVLPELELCPDTTERELGARLADAEVLITNKVRLTRERLAQAPRLRLVALTATGTNNVDLIAAQERRIAVCNINDYCTAAVVQQVFALILALTQRLLPLDTAVRVRGWRAAGEDLLPQLPIRELAGLTLGIVGYGTLGRAVARIGEAFGMQVRVANRPGARPVEDRLALNELLPCVDVLTLHCPINAATTGLIGARELSRMRADSLLINTARGGLVDARALAAALRAGRLGGAGIDVLEAEPPPPDHPLLESGIPNLIVTPHTAWAAREARQRALAEVAANVTDWLAGGRRGRVV